MNLIKFTKLNKKAKDYKATKNILSKHLHELTFKQFEILMYKMSKYEEARK